MDFSELEKRAYERQKMPDDLEFHEQQCYLALRNLYDGYKRGYVDMDQAKREKGQIRGEYDQNMDAAKTRWDLYKLVGDMRVKLASVNLEVQDHGCPLCKRMARIIDGLE